jgi:hypothetical protein
MTLGNMRENGVRSLFAYCRACHHEAIMNVDKYDAACHVPSFGPKMRCQRCGVIGADVRPNWNEQHAFGAFSGQ